MDREQIFGGNPTAVIIRLVILSIVVGIVMAALGITPANLYHKLNLLAGRIYDMGFGAFEWALGYFVVGAIVVVPIWLLARMFKVFGGSKRPQVQADNPVFKGQLRQAWVQPVLPDEETEK